ncbi:MAG: hypothetical protein ACE5IH_00010 [Thermodesulfobacteriota bacterium]
MGKIKSQKSKVKSQNMSEEENKAIAENIKWFSRFSPSEKIRIIERHKKELNYFLSLKVKNH